MIEAPFDSKDPLIGVVSRSLLLPASDQARYKAAFGTALSAGLCQLTGVKSLSVLKNLL